VLKQEEPFHCIRCDKPFGVKSTIERVSAKLEGRHWMFKGSAQRLDILKMCDDCRVAAMTDQEIHALSGKLESLPAGATNNGWAWAVVIAVVIWAVYRWK